VKVLVYLSVAEDELVDAAEYYDLQRTGLGRIFLDAVASTARKIQQHPLHGALRSRPIRSWRVERFPYRLLYAFEHDRITVVAVMHLSRNPDYWKERLD
jgi:toxin ParE1/3/4